MIEDALLRQAIDHWRTAANEAVSLAHLAQLQGWHDDAQKALHTLAGIFNRAADMIGARPPDGDALDDLTVSSAKAEMEDIPPGHPGADTGLGIVLIDEPQHCNVSTFADNGEVLLTFNARPGADFSQAIIGLSPLMAMQLVERLSVNLDAVSSAILHGKGGRGFSDA